VRPAVRRAYSNSHFDAEIAAFLRHAQPDAVLDIGAGAGKYGRMLREVSPRTHLTALEPDSEYIEQFGLREIYDSVLVGDVESLMRDVDTDHDVIILGDVIEHLRKSAGIDLLNFLVYRSRIILIVFPLRYRQGSSNGHIQEAHISVWGKSDFAWCDAVCQERDGMMLVRIQGFID